METTDRQHFFDIQRTMEFVPHTQHEGWLDYIAAKRQKEIVYFIDNTETHPFAVGEKFMLFLLLAVFYVSKGKA